MTGERVVAIEELGAAIEARGYRFASSGERCRLLDARFDVAITGLERHAQSSSIVSVLYSAERTGSATRPVPVICTADGAGLRQAARATAEQWLDLAFPVLHSVFTDHEPRLGVTVGRLTTVDRLTGRASGWRVHIGPIYTRCFGDADGIPAPDPSELVQHVVDALAGAAAHSAGFSIDLYAARSLQGQITTDCRIDNVPWVEGTEALRAAPASWPPFRAQMLTKRQVLCFEASATSPEAERDLRRRLNPKPPLWRRILGKR